jgi:hypothetical protein
MPVFEHLFPSPYNHIILDMLYILSTWHALAKLRLHADSTLSLLNTITTALGFCLRRFDSQVCKKISTVETDRERTARVERESKKGNTSASSGKKKRTFNMSTYKLHSLGDYTPSIKLFGTSDNWSTLRVGHPSSQNNEWSKYLPQGRARAPSRQALFQADQQRAHLCRSNGKAATARAHAAYSPRTHQGCGVGPPFSSGSEAACLAKAPKSSSSC